jgi:hypothetical protein
VIRDDSEEKKRSQTQSLCGGAAGCIHELQHVFAQMLQRGLPRFDISSIDPSTRLWMMMADNPKVYLVSVAGTRHNFMMYVKLDGKDSMGGSFWAIGGGNSIR